MKGHQDFLTTLVDLDQHQLVDVLDSHKQAEVMAALKQYPLEARAGVEEVSIDMWGGFTKVIETLFPNAHIVYDRFHVMQQVNRELNHLRHQMQVKFKGLPHLLWKNRETLTDEQRQRLDQGLQGFPCLAIAYELKEDLRHIYETSTTRHSAQAKLRRWLRFAELLYRKSAQMIRQHLSGICNYFEHHTTSGVTEGIHNKIKLIKRKGYGFSSFKHFRLRLLSCFSTS